MPRQVEWTSLIPAALAQLRATTSKTVYRGTLEQLFHIQRRTAIRLLHEFGGERVGSTFVVDRERLIVKLEEYAAPAHPLPGQVRRQHRDAAAFLIPDVRSPERRQASQLPASIRIQPGAFTVEHAGLADLLAQLWVFLDTCKDDRAGVEALLKGEKAT